MRKSVLMAIIAAIVLVLAVVPIALFMNEPNNEKLIPVVTNFKAATMDTDAMLTWYSESVIDSFEITRTSSHSGTPVSINTSNIMEYNNHYSLTDANVVRPMTYYYELRAKNSVGFSEVVKASCTFNGSNPIPLYWSPTFTSEPTLTAMVGKMYNYVYTTNESAQVGVLTGNAWLNANFDNQTLWGMPTVVGTFPFSLKVISDAGHLPAWQNWSVVVTNVIPPPLKHWPPKFLSTPVVTATVGANYTYHVLLNESVTTIGADWVTATSPSTYSAWGKTSTGIYISMTFNNAGSYPFFIHAKNAYGTAWQNFTVIVRSQTVPMIWGPTFVSVPSTTGAVENDYIYHIILNESGSFGVTFPDYPQPYSFSLYGLTSNSCYLKVSWNDGQPLYPGGGGGEHGGDYWYHVSVYADSAKGGMTTWQNWTTIVPWISPWPAAFTSTPPLTAVVGQFYTYHPTLNVTVGCLYMFAPLSDFPEGMGGWRGCTFTTPGVYNNFQAMAIRGGCEYWGAVSYQNWSVTVTEAPPQTPYFISAPSLSIITGENYTYHIVLNTAVQIGINWNNAHSPETYSAWGKTDTGVYISMTFVNPGNFPFFIEARNSLGKAWQNFTISVSGPILPHHWKPTITSVPSTVGHVGENYTYHFTFNESCQWGLSNLDLINWHWAISDMTSNEPNPEMNGWSGATFWIIPNGPGVVRFQLDATSVKGTLITTQIWTITVT
jgi:hypothetical protein